MAQQFDVDASTLFLGLTGSHAYGMARAGSDVDVRGVCLEPLSVQLSPFQQFEQFYPTAQVGAWGDVVAPRALSTLREHPTAGPSYETFGGAVDLCIYSLGKFVYLATKANPNILELLFLEDSEMLFSTSTWDLLRTHRSLFLSCKCKHTYLGYAHLQLKRILTHREWLLNPLSHEPLRNEYGLPEETVLPSDVRNLIDEHVKNVVREWSVSDGFEDILTGAYLDALTSRLREFQATVLQCGEGLLDDKLYVLAAASLGLSGDVLRAIKQERRYRAARKNWQKYQDWKKNRNPARAALEEKHGYDSKHAAHLVRLMRTGREVLSEGVLRVRRPDAEELLAIRDGILDFDELMELTSTLRAEVEAAEVNSSLPREPKIAEIESIYLELLGQP